MAKGNNNGKTRKSHNYKPYDTSNSSFVKRITTRVTEILPQPSSWISRWLSPASEPDVRQDSDEEEEDDEQRQPLRKRPCLNTTNHVDRTGLEVTGDISPILRNRTDHDKAIPGPSGIQLSKQTNFVFSTPAGSQPDAILKINGEEGSDSESTSGCSSLIPQGEKATPSYVKIVPKSRQPLHTPHNPISPSPSLSLGSSLQVSPTMSRPSKFSRLDSSRMRRPSFDSFVFSNPSISLNTSQRSNLDDSRSSPFYKGMTMYGGASSCREALNSSLVSPRAGFPKVVSVRPSATPDASKEKIGTSAMRILKALEQFSSPPIVPKRPINEAEKRKRKTLPPFEELVIPQMPDLLRIKRKEKPNLPSTSQSQPSTPSLNTTPNRTETQDRLRIPEPEASSFTGCIRGRKNENLETERFSPVILPDIKLPITTMPTFSLDGLPKRPINTKEKRLPTLLPSTSQVPLKTAPYTFSKPIVENTDGHLVSSIKPKIKFSEPLDANANETGPIVTFPKPFDKPVSPSNSTPSLSSTNTEAMFKFKPMPKLKEKKGSKENPIKIKATSVADYFKNSTTNSGFGDKFKAPKDNWECDTCLVRNSADKSKCAACETPKPNKKDQTVTSTSASDKWECKKCKLLNSETDSKCKSCSADKSGNVSGPLAKGLQNFMKAKTDTWECKECFVPNKTSEIKCVACSSPKPGASKQENVPVTVTTSTTAPPLSALYKKPSGNWECDVCLVSNKSDVEACAACSTPKPGCTPSAPKTTFSFGIPSSVTSQPVIGGGFSFGSNSIDKAGPSGFKLGPNSEDSPKVEFKFGIPSNEEKPKDSPKSTEAKIEKPLTNSEATVHSGNKLQTVEKNSSGTAIMHAFQTANKPDNESPKDGKITTLPKKRVSFGQPLCEEKIIERNDDRVKGGFQFKSFAKPDTTLIPPVFSFTSQNKPELNKKPTGLVSTEAQGNTNSIFKFGSSASSVSSTTEMTNTPSTLNSDVPKPNIFGAVLNSTTQPNENTNKKDKVFGGVSGVKEPKVVGFGSNTNKLFSSEEPKEEVKPVFGSNFNSFGATNDSKTNTIFGAKDEQTKSIFGNPPPIKENASVFGSKTENPTFNSEPKKEETPATFAFTNKMEPKHEENKFGAQPIFGEKLNNIPPNEVKFESGSLSKMNEENNKFVFGSNSQPNFFNNTSDNLFSRSIENKANATTVAEQNTPFGMPIQTIGNNTENKPVFTFNNSMPSQNSATSFGLFNKETENKPMGAFKFGATPNQQPQSNAFGFQSEPPKPLFSSPTPPTFNNPNPPSTNPLFTFGSNKEPQQPQQQQQPVFSFQSQGSSMPSPFAFGSQNSMPAQPQQQIQPPVFEPNMKPNFNFTSGATATFSAPPAPAPSGEVVERKYRKAIRRTK